MVAEAREAIIELRNKLWQGIYNSITTIKEAVERERERGVEGRGRERLMEALSPCIVKRESTLRIRLHCNTPGMGLYRSAVCVARIPIGSARENTKTNRDPFTELWR